jgi:hypothetical protein
MTRICTAHQRLWQASGVAAVLAAAYEAFEQMLAVIHPVQDPASGLFVVFAMAASSPCAFPRFAAHPMIKVLPSARSGIRIFMRDRWRNKRADLPLRAP